MENFKEQQVLKYKRLKAKELSEEQERKLVDQIQKQFGGIDLVLSKAAKANPALLALHSEAAFETQETVNSLREARKENFKSSEFP
mmetsp:Transcript_23074/g.30707  ORF Transcript_23074/g.30707 Transcript_23074/m.30707 type:complete len:86 (+) Transcript_23074:123-380(+)|eukprot:CAMPEP_0185569740 /NCGR_PEP_ID=MMETSP0434-20130131/2267_1 /TAXON_ID=626734 ORGANISM="Favella taraikaensis, Strain Fe Narragansett Bay" /NCGR_SAMPLE_ID=MMETSP0434 /ASSEMBLY_ACC=CAM_ASM_000379 /LENGTH=85 /DNA_ID=CAMNT_0028184617 /DNA_START=21 /DNA_END=278 /DNA_ORIENTATION=-